MNPLVASISSPFGTWPQWRQDAGLLWHTGDDMPGASGEPIHTTHVSRVEYVGSGFNVGDLGYYAVLTGTRDNGHQYGILHGHQDSPPPVGIGQRLLPGEVNGYIGCTGWCTGPHSHCMVTVERHGNGAWNFRRDAGWVVSPQLYLRGGYDAPGIVRELFDRPLDGNLTTLKTKRFVTRGELSLIGHTVKTVHVYVGGKGKTLIPGAPKFVNEQFPSVCETGTILLVQRKSTTEPVEDAA